LDEIPKPVVVGLLRAGDGWHGNDHRRFRHTPYNSSRTMGSLRRRDDNSRIKVQNVCKDSSAIYFDGGNQSMCGNRVQNQPKSAKSLARKFNVL